jgi:hypothetical protein
MACIFIVSSSDFHQLIFLPLLNPFMARRSQRKKAVSPETIMDADDEDFVAVASDDP